MILCVPSTASFAQAASPDTYAARDSPLPPINESSSPTFAQTLSVIAWPTDTFEVQANPPEQDRNGQSYLWVTFPSPHPSDHPALNAVSVRWLLAQGLEDADDTDARTTPSKRPAVVLVHTLHPQTPLTRMLARAIVRQGVHAFIVELPGYGLRRLNPDAFPQRNEDWPGVVALQQAARAVADVRRACDAVAALPGVDPDRIVLQGSSLGSFPAAVAAGLDARCHALLLFLGGGNAIDVIEHGQKDAARFRETLDRVGMHAGLRAQLIAPLEPLRVAHRLNPRTTWLLAARDDTVIPPENAQALADAIGLNDERFIQLPGNHYTASLALPAVADLLVRIAESDDPAALQSD